MNSSQKRALETHRRQLANRGLARYEVRGLSRDKELVRAFARRLADNDAGAVQLRNEVERGVHPAPPSGREIWLALKNSPLAGIDLDIEREVSDGRDVTL